MTRNQIARTWREHLVHKLQDRYGLAKEQAQAKADVWLQWVLAAVEKEPSSLQRQDLLMADPQDKSRPSRMDSRIRSSKSRSTAASGR